MTSYCSLQRVKNAVFFLFLSCLTCVTLSVQASVTVTDLAGREVTLTEQPERIILGDSRYLHALSILNQKNPVKPVVAMLSKLQWVDYGSFVAYQKRFPSIADIPVIGRSSADSFSIESAIALNADLAIFSLDGHGPNARHSNIIKILEKAGIKVIFVDFRKNPLRNTPKSLTLLGQVLGKEAQAKRFIDFYTNQIEKVTSKIATLSQEEKKRVFIHSRVGVTNGCCETMVRGMMADFVDAAGGNNIALPLIPGATGMVNHEYLLAQQPDVYIATAVGSKGMPKESPDDELPYVMLGAGVPNDFAQASLQQAFVRYKLTSLHAFQDKQAYALWHGFYNSPLNLVAVQVVAKWLYPEEFKELDPNATISYFFEHFQAIPLTGVYWTELAKVSHD
ncbi:MAG: ABC transporter substrate-binding protein [Paraglaciecola sp.]|uniref:ABC transporter substrate-binding protein n=1 Tax=Paraglaciecola sp. TaxID=1920173 RepID=UPI003295BD48